MTEDYIKVPKPSLDQKCSTCQHLFADHYTTYGGQKQGCTTKYYNGQYQMDPIITDCSCSGFKVQLQLPAMEW